MKRANIIGIDLAKNTFYFCKMNKNGKIFEQGKVSRQKLLALTSNLKSYLVAIEACGGAHYWASQFIKQGHQVGIIAPQNVKPYVKRQKNDKNDATAIAEAASRQHTKYVPIKQPHHQDIQCLHRVRSRLIKERTAIVNEMRGFLQEYGIVIAKGREKAINRIVEILYKHETSGLSDAFLRLLSDLNDQYKYVNDRVSLYDKELRAFSDQSIFCQRLLKIPGVGIVTATAMYYHISNWRVFKNGREFAASLGLVPRQNSTGGKTKLGRITKAGNSYIRQLLVHGARSAINAASQKNDRISKWIIKKKKLRGYNKGSVALANKVARMIWSMTAHSTEYQLNHCSVVV